MKEERPDDRVQRPGVGDELVDGSPLVLRVLGGRVDRDGVRAHALCRGAGLAVGLLRIRTGESAKAGLSAHPAEGTMKMEPRPFGTFRRPMLSEGER